MLRLINHIKISSTVTEDELGGLIDFLYLFLACNSIIFKKLHAERTPKVNF